jgi:hypothetical protein
MINIGTTQSGGMLADEAGAIDYEKPGAIDYRITTE